MTDEFTIVNEYLIQDLKKNKSWNKDMLDQIKFHDGSIKEIEGISEVLKNKYKESFEIDPIISIDLAAYRGKWVDQSQSHNIFVKGKSGKLLSTIYQHAWEKGLKTTYYLKSLGATQIEKSTLDAKKYGFTQNRNMQPKACLLDDPDCEACQ